MALWFEHWPGDRKFQAQCPVLSIAVAVVSLSKNFTLIAPVNPAV